MLFLKTFNTKRYWQREARGDATDCYRQCSNLFGIAYAVDVV